MGGDSSVQTELQNFTPEKRDGGQCTYRDKHGRRCTKRHDLEFHHVKPFGRGGDHSPEGIVLMCRTHNQLLAEEEFGKEKMARHRRRARRDTKGVKVAGVVGAGRGESDIRAQWTPTGQVDSKAAGSRGGAASR